MDIRGLFKFLADDVHTVIAATSGDTCAIDIMDYDDGGLYFLTAKGKGFYSRLERTPFIALTGVKGESTMSRKAASVRGKVKRESGEVRARLIGKNAYMRGIYPTELSLAAPS